MAIGDYICVPAAGTLVTSSTSATAWVDPGGWSVIGTPVDTYIGIVAVEITPRYVPAVDTTIEVLLEVGIGSFVLGQTMVAQIPFSYRSDTAVGYYMTDPVMFYFPEPLYADMSGGKSIYSKVYNSVNVLNIYDLRLYYVVQPAPSGSFEPVDPFGMMGIFGI
jgi:hypothetical protein